MTAAVIKCTCTVNMLVKNLKNVHAVLKLDLHVVVCPTTFLHCTLAIFKVFFMRGYSIKHFSPSGPFTLTADIQPLYNFYGKFPFKSQNHYFEIHHT
jgi:hypothetical protein